MIKYLIISMLLFTAPAFAAVECNGDADYIGASSALGVAGYPFSVVAWADSKDTTIEKFVLAWADSAENDRYIQLAMNESDSSFQLRYDTNTPFDTGWALPVVTIDSDNDWHMLAGVSAANNDHTFYIDDSSDNSTVTVDFGFGNIDVFGLCARRRSSAGYSNIQVGPVCIWTSTELSATQISQLYDSRSIRKCQEFGADHCYFLDEKTDASTIGSVTFKDYCGSIDLTGTDADSNSFFMAQEELSYP